MINEEEDVELVKWNEDQLKYLEVFVEEVALHHYSVFLDARRRASIKCGHMKNPEEDQEPTVPMYRDATTGGLLMESTDATGGYVLVPVKDPLVGAAHGASTA